MQGRKINDKQISSFKKVIAPHEEKKYSYCHVFQKEGSVIEPKKSKKIEPENS